MSEFESQWKHASNNPEKRGEYLEALKEIIFDLQQCGEDLASLEYFDNNVLNTRTQSRLTSTKVKIDLLMRKI